MDKGTHDFLVADELLKLRKENTELKNKLARYIERKEEVYDEDGNMLCGYCGRVIIYSAKKL
jgi:hypothetical protein